MRTLAQYSFVLRDGGKVAFHIHNDGYAEGAAAYFLFAHLSSARGSFADRFHRANERAEICSMDSDQGVLFRYAVADDGSLVARRRVRNDRGDAVDKWVVFFRGHYAEFINRYALPADLIEGPLRLIYTPRRAVASEWVTRAQLERRHTIALAKLLDYRDRYPEMTVNIEIQEAEVRELWRAIEQFDGQVVRPSNSKAGPLQSPRGKPFHASMRVSGYADHRRANPKEQLNFVLPLARRSCR
ncbi:hypothetical protein [Paraburkholderia nodosa]|uniref:hypothetical protein n=1 Tax=Paraburkholderia nodosa TaxID=392320 RepID=UPI00084207C6|nr:hypothetical protein [Paraburkholderia nodosa]